MIGRLFRALIVLVGVAAATPAFAHASLVSSSPPDGVLLEVFPKTVELTFNEPVAVVGLQVTDEGGGRRTLADAHVEGDTVVASLPDGLPMGTTVVTWRVVSSDGHPIGGTVLFSVGRVTQSGEARAAAAPTAHPDLYSAIWLVGVILFAAQFAGVGGSFFLTWIAPKRAAETVSQQIVLAMLLAGVASAALSLGLEGADLLDRGLDGVLDGHAWAAALGTSYGATVMVSDAAFVLAMLALMVPSEAAGMGLSAVALALIGVALSLSGHAAGSPAPVLSWAATFLHTIGAAFWIGSLLPLAAILLKRTPQAHAALARFSRAIPFAIVPLILAGVLLAFVQLNALSDFWTTDYGQVLALKLAVVVALFALAADNRLFLTGGTLNRDRSSTASLRRSIIVEAGLMVVILGLVELWRFTPPPHAIAAVLAAQSGPVTTRVTAPSARGTVTVTPGRAGPVRLTLDLTGPSSQPLAAKEVSVDLANPEAGIGTITKSGVRVEDGTWRVEGLTLPVGGVWRLTVNALISDFEEANLEGSVVLRK